MSEVNPTEGQFEREEEELNLDDELLGKAPAKQTKQTTVMTNTLSHEDYSFFYENSVWEQYEDLVYAIQRGKVDDAIRIFKQEGITIDEVLRPVRSILSLLLVGRHRAPCMR